MPEKRPRGRPRAFHDKTEQNTIQSLDRAMLILETLASSGGLTLTGLAGTLDQSPATVYRVLTTLEARDIVELEAQSQTWHVGAGAFRIGSGFLRRTNLVERARPIMHDLMGAEADDMPEYIKGAMLSCILSDTLEFRSPTTTDRDREVAAQLN